MIALFRWESLTLYLDNVENRLDDAKMFKLFLICFVFDLSCIIVTRHSSTVVPTQSWKCALVIFLSYICMYCVLGHE